MDAAMDLEDVPPGVFPVLLSESDQETFHLVISRHITAADPIRFIEIEEILKNMEEQPETSPFLELQDEITGCTEEEIVIAYDYKHKFGGNFFICLTPTARNWLLSKSKSTITQSEREDTSEETEETTSEGKSRTTDDAAEVDEKSATEEEEEEEIPFVPYSPPLPKEWICGGSDLEIDEEIIKETRPKFTLVFQKEVKYYDSEKEPEFSTRHVIDNRFGYVECPPYEDLDFGLQRLEIDTAVQAASVSVDAASQTTYRHPKNVWVQTEPREMALEEKRELEQSGKLKQFLNKVMPRLLTVLQQNELMDVFEDEWDKLGPVEFLHGKLNNEIKEYQSFSELQFSKDKLVTSVVWHPMISGIAAVACVDRLTFDSRIDRTSKLLLQASCVLLWSIKDPIHPQLILEAPDEMQCIAFNPLAAHILVGGCSSGQVCLWDLSDHMEKLRLQKPVDAFSVSLQEVKFVDPPPLVATVRYAAGSAVEYSHAASVEDIEWIPDQIEIEAKGTTIESEHGFCYQLMTCGLDCIVRVWDIRPDKQLPLDAKFKSRDKEFPLGIPNTFQFLDTTWRPIYSFELLSANQIDRFISTRISIQEVQDYRIPDSPFTLHPPPPPQPEETEEEDEEQEKPEHRFKTTMFIGSLDGNIAGVDWVAEKDSEGKTMVKITSFTENLHGGPVTVVEHSPFLRNIVLSVGLWRFAIWRVEQIDPLLLFRSPARRLLTAKWSHTRPSVFFIGKEDGTLDVWDLQDKSHEPIIMYTVSAAAITAMDAHPNPQTGKDYMLAVADSVGVLHLLVLPPYLTHPLPNELEMLEEFFLTELDCIAYRAVRRKYYQDQRTGKVQQIKETTTPKFRIEEAETVVEDAKYTLFKEYLKMEKQCFAQLGIVESKELPVNPVKVPDQSKGIEEY